MRRSASLTLFLAILSVIAGYMLSSASWIGNIGIDLFYREYEFLQVWWKGALVIFGLLVFLYAVQSLVQKMASANISRIVNIFAIVAAFVGLYLTYDDFRHTLSHRWMGERFHIGVYLFWIGWMIISIYLMMSKKNARAMKKKVGLEI